MKLFCLPCAGSSAAQYFQWKEQLKEDMEVIPIDYPGHGTLSNLPLVTTMEELIQNVVEQIQDKSDEEPFSILGHSMGACVAYEVAKLYQNNHEDSLQALFICGSAAPNFYLTEYKYLKEFSDEQFLDEVTAMGGIPAELLVNQVMLDYYFPIIKNDFTVLEYYFPELIKLEIPVYVLAGNEDEVVKEKYKYWKMYAKKTYTYVLDGDHFFVNTNEKVLEVLRQYCSEFESKYGERVL